MCVEEKFFDISIFKETYVKSIRYSDKFIATQNIKHINYIRVYFIF